MKKIMFIPSLIALCITPYLADACTGMYAGKKVTTDASVLIGRTVDFSPYNATMFQQICERGTQVAFDGTKNKYRYICAPKSTSLNAWRYAGSAINEKGVILTGTITGATNPKALENDPFDPVKHNDNDVGEPNLPDYMIGNAATAREAVELLAESVRTRGHDGAEIYMVADTNEAWYIEVYTGHQWAAVKMPDDKVAVFGNHFNLRGFDTSDAENVMYSPGLITLAVENGFDVWTDETKTKLDLYKTYADPNSVEKDYLNFRAWYGHKRFADKSLPEYKKDLLPELFFEPGYEIAPTNMFELMRARYEEMSDEELPTARTNFPIRVIGTVKQGNCHVLQLDCRETTSENMRATLWSCLGNCEHGVFHPINASQDYLPDAYTNDEQRTFGYDPNRAADAFRRLSALTQSNRELYGPRVRNYWRADEMRRAEEWPAKLNEAIASGDTATLSAYTRTEEEKSFAAAKRMYDELLWEAAANNCIDGDGIGAADGTGFYVGKEVSVDGTTMIGQTMDFPPCNAARHMNRFERGEKRHFDGTKNKYAFICASLVTSMNKGFYGGEAINEKGVMLSATVSGRTNENALDADPFKPVADGGVGEQNLPDWLIGNAATAREAVKLLGEAVADSGHAGPEIYMVADTNEAWYIEVYTGHQWAAVKMPDDKVAVFGSQFNIREFNTNETEYVMYSPGLVSLAVENGFDVWKDKENGIIDLYATYSPPLWDYANYRTFWGHNAWAPTEYPSGSYSTRTHYELFFTPEKKIALTDIFELMRTRYEGVNCPEENDDIWTRVIGTAKQASCHVLQMRHALPEEYRCTLWESLAQAEHSTFLPMCMAVNAFPSAYTRDQYENFGYDPTRAADAFLRLDTLAELKRFIVDTYGVRQDVRPYYGAGVRAFWLAQEERLIAEWPKMLDEWILRGKSGCIMASAYIDFNQTWTLADAKRLHDELAWYWTEFNCDLRDGGGSTDVPTYPFASSMPTNSELGVAWTRWHRTEFDALVEELAGPTAKRPPEVVQLVKESKHVFDGVEDADTLAEAKVTMADIVRDIALYSQGPIGSESNPWAGGELVIVWTNGTGSIIFDGKGRMDDFESMAPWAVALPNLAAARVAEAVTLGANSLKGIASTAPINGIVPSDLLAAIGEENPAGAISGAEFERVKIVDGKAHLDVSVHTSETITNPNWSVATNCVITVPAEGKRGFFYLMSKPADSSK